MRATKNGGLGKEEHSVEVDGRLEGSLGIFDILCPYC